MSKRVLITGGVRSGKSRMAEQCATQTGLSVVYLATCQPQDEEMLQRVQRHRQDRPAAWTTVEEPLDIESVVVASTGKVVLLDCLTLWVTNLMMDGLDAQTILRRVDALIDAECDLIMVSNEVGWGIVPDNALARQFRDIVGWMHQRIAARADEVILMVAGLPLYIKRSMT